MTIHKIEATAETVNVGVIDRAFAPILEIESGDTLDLETWGLWANAVVPGTTVEQVAEIKSAYVGKGPHSMTGPIKIKDAQPGMTIKVEILELKLGPHGFNMITPLPRSRGLLSEDFPTAEIRHFIFDADRKFTDFVNDIKLPLRPFLGILGVAPASHGPHISSVPGPFGGNIDCPDFTVGTTVYLPVWVEGALFYAGDAHAMQGCGEVTQTALETSMESAKLRLELLSGAVVQRPHAETKDYLITMGFDQDIHQAAKQAVRDMVTWLSTSYGLNKSDAYVLCSLKADLIITQIVNGNNGVHVRLPKALFHANQVTA